jgi:gamma-glutamylcyclotransferase (GGCT)/AIG2-like uncharacterized protein YtfP
MCSIPLRLFVYGTLKRGQRSHKRFCIEATEIQPAAVLGRLFHLPAGYPMLIVPKRKIVAVGTRDPRDDLTTQFRWDEQAGADGGPGTVLSRVDDLGSDDDWEPIEGELLSFADPAAVLPQLDDFEDFRPAAADTTYLRVLTPLAGDGSRHVWTYVAPDGRLPVGARRIRCSWPSGDAPVS